MSFLCLSVLHGGRAVILWTVTGIPVGTTFLALFDQLRAGALEAFAGHAPVLLRLNNEVMNNNRPPAPKSRKWLMRNNKSSLSGLSAFHSVCVSVCLCVCVCFPYSGTSRNQAYKQQYQRLQRDTGMKYKMGFFFKTLRSEVMASFTHLE